MPDEQRRGMFYALACYGVWGLVPLYWHAMNGVVGHRYPGQSHGVVAAFCAAAAGLAPPVELDRPRRAQPAHCADVHRRRAAAGSQLVYLYLGGDRRLHRGEQPGLFHHPAGQCAVRGGHLSRAAPPRPMGLDRAGGGRRALLDARLRPFAVDRSCRWPLPLGAMGCSRSRPACLRWTAWPWKRPSFSCRRWLS